MRNLTTPTLFFLASVAAISASSQCTITLEKQRSGKQITLPCDRLLDIIVNDTAVQVFGVEIQEANLIVASQHIVYKETADSSYEEVSDTTLIFSLNKDLSSIQGLVMCDHRKIEKCAQVRQNQKFGVWLDRSANIITVLGIAGFVFTGNYYLAAGAGVGILISAFANKILKVKYYGFRKQWRIVGFDQADGSTQNEQNPVE